MPGQCDACGVEEYMPYVCKFCRGRYCAAHRLPENHACAGLGAYREKMRAEGRVMAPEPGVVKPTMSAGARAGMSMDAFWSKVDGKMTYVFLGTMLAVYVLQWMVILTAGADAHNALFVITNDWVRSPWTLVTSVFAHSPVDFWHIVFNGLGIYFFGTTTERLIGTRRFTWAFLAAGVLAGIAQVALFRLFYDADSGGLGASGALMGIMGILTVIAPRLTVLFMGFIPTPLWAIAIVYAMLDIFGAFNPGAGVGNFAHLAGLAFGLAFGYYLRQKGLRAVVTRPPPVMRRF